MSRPRPRARVSVAGFLSDDGDQHGEDMQVSINNDVRVEKQGDDGEALTPVLRPWSDAGFKRESFTDSQTKGRGASYDPNQYITNESDHSHCHMSPSSSSEDGSLDKFGEPLTPSRLLTLNSFDFMDTDLQRDAPSLSSGLDNSVDSLVQSKGSGNSSDGSASGKKRSCSSKSSSRSDINEHTQNEGVMTTGKLAHSPIIIPAPEVTDEDLKHDLVVHGDIVTDYTSQLTVALKSHVTEIMNKLSDQKLTELRGRDDFYTKELQKQQIIIEDLEEVVATYEKNLLGEEATVLRYREMLERVCVCHRQRYISPFSLMRLLQAWKLYTTVSIRMYKQNELASKHRTKVVLRFAFDELQKEAKMLQAERRGLEEKKHFDKTVRDLVGRYEAQIAKLTMDLQESQDALCQEKARRQQLEEDLRRMFLKNMTVMNMEALSLFQAPVSAPPQLAEFGPDRRQADAVELKEATFRHHEERLQHMRQQQQQLQTHQHEYKAEHIAKGEHQRVRTKHAPVSDGRLPTMMRHTRDNHNVHSPRQNTSPRGDRNHHHSTASEYWEDEDALPRETPHPQPYETHHSYRR